MTTMTGPHPGVAALQCAAAAKARAERAANARRREVLERDRAKAVRLCQLHHGRDQQAYIKAWRRLSHVDELIFAGEQAGRW